MPELVRFQRHGDVLVVEIDNPPVNALGPGVPEGLSSALDVADRDDGVLAIVVRGAGRTFVAGADISTLEDAAWGDPSAAPEWHDLLGHIDQRRTTARNIRRREFGSGPIGHVKRPALRVEDADGAFDNEPMQIPGPNCFAKSFTEPVKKIEDERLFDHYLLFRTLELLDATPLPPRRDQPTCQSGDEQPGK